MALQGEWHSKQRNKPVGRKHFANTLRENSKEFPFELKKCQARTNFIKEANEGLFYTKPEPVAVRRQGSFHRKNGNSMKFVESSSSQRPLYGKGRFASPFGVHDADLSLPSECSRSGRCTPVPYPSKTSISHLDAYKRPVTAASGADPSAWNYKRDAPKMYYGRPQSAPPTVSPYRVLWGRSGEIDEVAAHLEKLRLGFYAPQLVQLKLTLDDLRLATDADLRDYGIYSMGARRKILNSFASSPRSSITLSRPTTACSQRSVATSTVRSNFRSRPRSALADRFASPNFDEGPSALNPQSITNVDSAVTPPLPAPTNVPPPGIAESAGWKFFDLPLAAPDKTLEDIEFERLEAESRARPATSGTADAVYLQKEIETFEKAQKRKLHKGRQPTLYHQQMESSSPTPQRTEAWPHDGTADCLHGEHDDTGVFGNFASKSTPSLSLDMSLNLAALSSSTS